MNIKPAKRISMVVSVFSVWENVQVSELYVSERLTIPSSDLQWSASRSGGPGGQNVNKVNSKVTLKFNIRDCKQLDAGWRHRVMQRHGGRVNQEGELVLQSEVTRDQSRNLADARARLTGLLLECQFAPKTRRKTKPTLGSKRRRMEKKRQTGEKKRLRRGRFGADD